MAESRQELIEEELKVSCRSKSLKALAICLAVTAQMLLSGYSTAYSARKERIIKNVPIESQFPQLPTGCEATAATMFLKWAGVCVSKEEIAKKLPKGSIPRYKNGRLYGSNPDHVFVGDPFSKYGYGTFRGPIINIINKYLPGRVLDVTGTDFDSLLRIIDSNRPVIIWGTINNMPARVSKVWYDSRGNKIVWKTPEHAVVLVGYTDTHVIVNDPWAGKRKYYPISAFEKQWKAMGSQAVTIKNSGNSKGRIVIGSNNL